MSRTTSSRSRRIATALLLLVGALALTTGSASAASWSGSCTATKVSGYGPSAFVVWSGTSATLNTSGSTARYVDFNMGSPWWQPVFPPGPTLPWLDGTGNKNNVNIKSPVTRNSPDSLGQSGRYDFTDFTFAPNSNVRIEMIPDIRNVSDPKCSIYITVA
ncbi:MAG: hypothetical protein AAGF02_16110 [Actinomycetota bacterium]